MEPLNFEQHSRPDSHIGYATYFAYGDVFEPDIFNVTVNKINEIVVDKQDALNITSDEFQYVVTLAYTAIQQEDLNRELSKYASKEYVGTYVSDFENKIKKTYVTYSYLNDEIANLKSGYISSNFYTKDEILDLTYPFLTYTKISYLATKEELPNLTGYATKEWVDTNFIRTEGSSSLDEIINQRIDDKVESLYVDKYSYSDSFISYTYEQNKGIVSIDDISLNTASVTDELPEGEDALATVRDVKDALENIETVTSVAIAEIADILEDKVDVDYLANNYLSTTKSDIRYLSKQEAATTYLTKQEAAGIYPTYAYVKENYINYDETKHADIQYTSTYFSYSIVEESAIITNDTRFEPHIGIIGDRLGEAVEREGLASVSDVAYALDELESDVANVMYHLVQTKQDVLTPGDGVTIKDNVISAQLPEIKDVVKSVKIDGTEPKKPGSTGILDISTAFAKKQNNLIAGDSINIDNVTISSYGFSVSSNNGFQELNDNRSVSVNNIASGVNSHAEGNNTSAYGNYSHTEGLGTIAQGVAQHVGGKYNVIDSNALFIIGNGSSNTSRSNALYLSDGGNLTVANNITSTNGTISGKNISASVSVTAPNITNQFNSVNTSIDNVNNRVSTIIDENGEIAWSKLKDVPSTLEGFKLLNEVQMMVSGITTRTLAMARVLCDSNYTKPDIIGSFIGANPGQESSEGWKRVEGMTLDNANYIAYVNNKQVNKYNTEWIISLFNLSGRSYAEFKFVPCRDLNWLDGITHETVHTWTGDKFQLNASNILTQETYEKYVKNFWGELPEQELRDTLDNKFITGTGTGNIEINKTSALPLISGNTYMTLHVRIPAYVMDGETVYTDEAKCWEKAIVTCELIIGEDNLNALRAMLNIID